MRSSILVLLVATLGLANSKTLSKGVEEDFPDIGLNPHQMIERQGYPAETYWVTTEDGYILQVNRIPNPGGRVIFLQHGSLSSSADWLLMGPKTFPYLLHDKGYDVWLGNARGNTWSRNHTTFNPDTDLDYWDFTFHEMGVYDLPAVLTFVMDSTGSEQIDYVGHSMGTTMFWVLCAEKPEWNAKFRQMHAFAPVAWMMRTRSFTLLSIAPWVWVWDWWSSMLGQGEYLPSSEFSAMVGATMCQDGQYTQAMCAMEIFQLCGYSPSQLNDTTLPLIKAFSPAGTSTKNILHYTKQILSWQFEQYDYGWIENMDKYGQMTPPEYRMNRITAPIYLHLTDNDYLAHPMDVDVIHDRISNSQGKFKTPMTWFSHIDFIWGIDAQTQVWDLVFVQLDSWTPTP